MFLYRQPDGTIRRELRPPEEVFDAASLDTLKAAPVTDLHPQGMVTPSNWKTHAIGHVSEDVRQDGQFIASDLNIQDEGVIKAIESEPPQREELSCGYTCHLDFTPGVFNGEHYDAIQRGIRYNHVAIGPKGWGRAGQEVSLRLDASDAIQVPAESPPPTTKEARMKVTIDGVDYEAGTSQHLQAEKIRFDRMSGEIATLKKERDQLQGERDQLQGKLDAAEDPSRLDALVEGRFRLHEDAKSVLGKVDLSGKTDREIMVETIRHDDQDFNPENMSDDYLRGRFEAATRSSKRHDQGGNGIGAARSAAVSAVHQTSQRQDGGQENRFDARAARQRMLDNNAQAASQPLRFSRSQ